MRAVADFAGPWTIRELVDVAKASTGATYRVVEYLEREGMAERDERGLVIVPDWAQVLRRWSNDYGFVRNNRITRWIAPRGLSDLTKRMGSADALTRYAVSGSQAAAEWAAYAPVRLAMVYVADADQASDAWDLRPADAGANVMVAEPEIDVVFERSLTNREDVVPELPERRRSWSRRPERSASAPRTTPTGRRIAPLAGFRITPVRRRTEDPERWPGVGRR